MRTVRVRVPASTSNLGPGFDMLGLALDRALVATFEPGGAPIEVRYEGLLAGREGRGPDLAEEAFRASFPPGRAPGGQLMLRSEIPVARGLGSSAAARVAGQFLADLVRGLTPDRGRILTHTAELEGHADNAAPAVLGGFVAAMFGPRGLVTAHLPLSPEVGFVFGDPGVELATADARRVLPARVPHEVAAATGARVALLLKGLAVADPELVAAGLDDVLHVPYRLPLIEGAAAAARAAVEAGAWGVTLSGSGSGLLALTAREHEREVAEALRRGLAGGGHDRADALVVRPDPLGARVEEATESRPPG
jgi:homoserine kinase